MRYSKDEYADFVAQLNGDSESTFFTLTSQLTRE